MPNAAQIAASVNAFEQLKHICGSAVRNEAVELVEPADASLPDLAMQHGVFTLVASRLAGVVDDAGRAAVLEQERELRYHALDRMRELMRVHALLSEHAVSHLAIKGPTLSVQLYDDATTRISGDLDFLLRWQDCATAVSVLERAGFTHLDGAIRSLAMRRRFDHEIGLMSPGGMLVELQWAWAQPHFAVDAAVDQNFDRSVSVQLGSAVVQTLDPADLIVYLAVHGAKHGWSRLDLCCDFARAILCFASHLPRARARAAQMHLADVLGTAEVLAWDLFRTGEEVRVSARVRSIANQYAAVLSGRGQHNDLKQMIVSRERAFDRLRSVARLTFVPSPTDYALVNLPTALHPLYFALRPLRIVASRMFRRG